MNSQLDHRVAITGIGMISPLGNGLGDYWEAVCHGRSGVRQLTILPDNTLPVPYGAQAWNFSGHIDDFGDLSKPQKRAIRKGLKLMCREIQLAVATAQRALQDAQLTEQQHVPERNGILFGCDHISTLPQEFVEATRACLDDQGTFQYDRWAPAGLPKVTPLWLLKYLPNMPASHIAIYNDFRGPSNTVTYREASSYLALGEACSIITRGAADRVVAGATGSSLHPMRAAQVVLQTELAQGRDDPAELCRPFERDRTGTVIGEGAASMVLENWELARRRGATIYGEIVGRGSSVALDRHSRARTRLAIANALRQAIQGAKLTPDQVGHYNAHGLGTRLSDRAESQAVMDVFAGRKAPLPVVALKSYFGNLGAASGLIELVGSLLAFTNGHLPATLNYKHADPECPIHVVSSHDAPPGDCVLAANCTAMGQASAIVVRRAT